MVENKLKELYSLYEAWEYEKASKLNNEILTEDPNNIYAKRYVSLLSSKNKSEVKSEIPKVKWKQLKCPHCVSKISFTGLTETQQSKIKSWDYSNLDIKCPYCHTTFLLQKKTAKSILGLKIWEEIEYEGKKYRITWYVQYEWRWIEWEDSWKVSYLEWILLWEKNEYLYFSEGYSVDDWKKEFEFEFSKKFIPQWKITLHNYKEKDKLKVKSIYWENSKSFKIWEYIEILDFWRYVYEKEVSWSQIEWGFYRWKNFSRREAANIFNKEISKRDLLRVWKSITYLWFWERSFLNGMWWSTFVAIMTWLWWDEFDAWELISFTSVVYLISFFIIIYIILFVIPKVFWYKAISWAINNKVNDNNSNFTWIFKNIVIFWFVIGPIFAFFIVKPIFLAFETEVPIQISEINNWNKFDIKYNVSDRKVVKTVPYDMWGKKKYYEQKVWIKFSVKNEDDKKIIKKIVENGNSIWWELWKISSWKAYIIK